MPETHNENNSHRFLPEHNSGDFDFHQNLSGVQMAVEKMTSWMDLHCSI